jgi:hypothetical protein
MVDFVETLKREVENFWSLHATFLLRVPELQGGN